LLAIVAAVKEEINPVLKSGKFSSFDGPDGALSYEGQLASGASALIIASGMGKERSEAATEWLVRQHNPTLIISVGFGGGTKSAIDTSTIVISTSVSLLKGSPLEWSLPADLESIEADARWASVARMAVELNGIDFAHGPIITVPIVARSPGMKEWLGGKFGVYSVDLESYWVAKVATDASIPFLGIRVIVDSVDMTLPELVSQMPDTPSGGRTGKAISYALKSPRNISELTRLGRTSSRAGARLAEFLAAFASDFQNQTAPVVKQT